MASRNDSVWTTERDITLERLWGQGKTASEIASELACFGNTSDGGRSAVCSRVKRKRDGATTDDDKKFWSRGRAPAAPRAPRQPRAPKTQRTPAIQGSTGNGARQSHELTQTEKRSLIDSVPKPVIRMPTDAEVRAAHMLQLDGKFDFEDRDGLWSRPRHEPERDTFRPKCTEPMPGMRPCGKPTFGNSARCEDHGGRLIASIKFTGEDTSASLSEAAE